MIRAVNRPAMYMNVNPRTRLAESRIAKIRLHDKTPFIINISRGEHQVNVKLHTGLQGGNCAALIGRIQRDPDQAQGHHQYQCGQYYQAESK